MASNIPLFTLMNPLPPVTRRDDQIFREAAAATDMNLIAVLHMDDANTGNFAALDWVFSVLRPNGLFRVNLLGMPVDTLQTAFRTVSPTTSYTDSAPAPLAQPIIWDPGFCDPLVGGYPLAFRAIVGHIAAKGFTAQFHGFGFCPAGPNNTDGEFTIVSRYTDQNGVKHDYSQMWLDVGYTEQRLADALASIYTGVEDAAPGLRHRLAWFVPNYLKLGYNPDPIDSLAHTCWQAMLDTVPEGMLTPIDTVMDAHRPLGFVGRMRGRSNGRLALQTITNATTKETIEPVIKHCFGFDPDWVEVHPVQAVFAANYASGFTV